MKGQSILFIATFGVVSMIFLAFFFYYFGTALKTTADVLLNTTNQTFGDNSTTYNATKSISESVNSFFAAGDFIAASMFFGLILGALASAILVRFHPIFLPAYMFFTIISIYMSMKLKDMYVGLVSSLPWLSSYPYTTTVMQFLPHIVAIVGGLIILLQYAFRGDV